MKPKGNIKIETKYGLRIKGEEDMLDYKESCVEERYLNYEVSYSLTKETWDGRMGEWLVDSFETAKKVAGRGSGGSHHSLTFDSPDNDYYKKDLEVVEVLITKEYKVLS